MEKLIDDVARAQFRTCTPPSYSNFWSILSQTFFLQKIVRNDVLSDRKVLQRFRGIGKGLFTSPLVLLCHLKKWWEGAGGERRSGGGTW